MSNTCPSLDAERAAAFAAADRAYTFGPSFFFGYLAQFVRDRCPDSAEHLPTVQILLADGEVLDLCHVIGVTERWVLLAVWDGGSSSATNMAVDIVPFELIRRVCIRTRPAEAGAVGFGHAHRAEIIRAETLVSSLNRPRHEYADVRAGRR